jgi:hypothetical protein
MDVEEIVHGAVPRVDGDAVSGIEVNFAFGQVKAAGGDEASRCKGEEQVNDATEHEEGEDGGPYARG